MHENHLTPPHPLALWRERRGLSMEKFGAMAGTTASTICRIEQGKIRPQPELAERIARATGGEVSLRSGVKKRLLPRGHQTR
jgi:transcriptional regulator with XRE-family HTH domain